MKLFNHRIKKSVLSLVFITLSALFSVAIFAEPSLNEPQLDQTTGLVIAKGFELVKAHCTACHSGKLVSQNKMSRESWLATIRWMQKTQGLWPLGEAEGVILDYLATNYHPVNVGRRPPLPKTLMPAVE